MNEITSFYTKQFSRAELEKEQILCWLVCKQNSDNRHADDECSKILLYKQSCFRNSNSSSMKIVSAYMQTVQVFSAMSIVSYFNLLSNETKINKLESLESTSCCNSQKIVWRKLILIVNSRQCAISEANQNSLSENGGVAQKKNRSTFQ